MGVADVNTIEAAALQAIREYYREHERVNGVECGSLGECSACRKARTFASLIGVDLDKEDEA